ncbi:MAG TPA: nuclear transport factor 2 family protein [Cyclobacteriaceae bacterium]
MNSNEKLITTFYSAFQNKNWQTMQSCYHDDIIFNDPVFMNLKGKEAKAMWHMLISSGKDLTLIFTSVKADERIGSCSWEAFYTFSRTGRKVHNVIEAKFEFKDGKIIRHTDSFDLWKWSGMALGLSGILLGWSSVIRNKVQGTAKASLDKFRSVNAVYLD